ncbi:Organic Anion Transporter Polypeptide (OATP) family protein [Novymonas esmeraldas]|uniref:Organic Anion Transporter Polypeptide (OATP) family protein n=1 Tax=Novymonas esmeraldas TaxID=1808958 RepID=A0AAW0ENE3_9TRYP
MSNGVRAALVDKPIGDGPAVTTPPITNAVATASSAPTADNSDTVTAAAAAMKNSGDRDGVRKVPHTNGGGDTVLSPVLHARSTSTPDGRTVSRRAEVLSTVDSETVYRNLLLFVWLKTIGSFDSGAFSAALGAPDGISEAWRLDAGLQGTLTSSVFLGNVVGCPLAGHLFSRYNEKRVLCAALVVHTVFTFLFAAFPTYDAALLNRFCIGVSLAFIVVYTPVWVDEFAPATQQSLWMASHNAGVPLGIMLGYVLAAAPQSFTSTIGWSWSFYIKCVLMVPTIAYVARVDSRTINTRKVDRDDGGGHGDRDGNDAAAAAAVTTSHRNGTGDSATSDPTPPPPPANARARVSAAASGLAHKLLNTSLQQVWEVTRDCVLAVVRGVYTTLTTLLSNGVYICCVVSLTSMYFVATGLQNFVTQYLREPPFNASMVTVMLGFGFAVVTAPVCGVIVGGILLDRIGGYKHNLRRVTVFVLVWGSCAVIFSVVCIFVRTTHGFLLVMSVVLFCGGVIIPPGAGLTMASLPGQHRSVGAAFAQTMYNLFGNFSGPLVCGIVAQVTGSLRYGIITVLLSSALGVAPLLVIVYIAFTRDDSPEAAATTVALIDGSGDDDVDDDADPTGEVMSVFVVHGDGDGAAVSDECAVNAATISGRGDARGDSEYRTA